MKLLLKLLLIVVLLAVAVYAATPLWLPSLVSNQLPAGWQLDSIDPGYPGLSAIRINSLRVSGEQDATGFAVAAADIRLNYRGPVTAIGTLVIDMALPGDHKAAAARPMLEELSLPVTNIAANVPQLAVQNLRLLLHHELPLAGESPLVFNFKALEITPATAGGFDVTAGAGLEDSTLFNGRLDARVRPARLDAGITFPGTAGAPSWLKIAMRQQHGNGNPTTRLEVQLDTDLTEAASLEPVVMQTTGGKLTAIEGNLELEADFAGKDRQSIRNFSVTSPNLKLTSDSGVLELRARLQARREGQGLLVTLAEAARIAHKGPGGWIDELLTRAAPGFERRARSEAESILSLGPASRFIVQAGPVPSLAYTGDVKFEMTSSDDQLNLQTAGLQLKTEDFSSPGAAEIAGLVTLDWVQDGPFSYTDGELVLQADKLAVNMELSAHSDKFISRGNGAFTNASIPSLTTSAKRVDVQWQELDLANLTGEFSTQTYDFATRWEGETWTGFDFDVAYQLRRGSRLNGTGSLQVKNGPKLPLAFAGDTASNQWDITLPPTTLNLQSVPRLMALGHLELPESASLNAGNIDFQGHIESGDRFNAQIDIRGYDINAAMSASSARGSGFELAVQLDDTLQASGPVSIESVALAGGVEMVNLRADLNMENRQNFALRNFYAEVFDGQLQFELLGFSNNRLGETTARLSRIDFGRLLEFTDIEGLTGTGTLEISLPLGSDETGIYIKNGTFTASGPGRIAYSREGLADNNIGFRALENFQYEEMSGTLDYQSDGSYRIGIHLRGSNPDLYAGHPIVFNLNIGGVLPALFEALFMTGDFEESILKQLRINTPEDVARSG
jgi:hypothetical protein